MLYSQTKRKEAARDQTERLLPRIIARLKM